MRPDVQKEVSDIWEKINQQNLSIYADFAQYQKDFLNLHGFEYDEIDYGKDVEI
jgi:enoyl-[acyl-carrier protein] reductase/trans-2-enoyl-CoA reductase (NAD+)